MAYGKPVSGKSTAVEAVMAVIGMEEKNGDCTFVGANEILARQTLPFWWGDVADFDVLEDVANAAFNKFSLKEKRKIPKLVWPPAWNCSNNDDESNNRHPHCEEKQGKIITYLLSDGCHTIHQAEACKKNALQRSLMFQAELKHLMRDVVKSVDILIELRDCFAEMKSDPLFQEAVATVEEVTVPDIRAHANYALVLYSTAKILEKIGLKEDMLPKVNEWMTKVVLPHYTTLVGKQQVEVQDERTANGSFHESAQQRIRENITTILNKAIENPEMGKHFVNPHFSVRSCDCGDVVYRYFDRESYSMPKLRCCW